MKHGLNNLWPTQVMFENVKNEKLLEETIQDILLTANLEIPQSDFQQHDILADGSAIIQEFRKEIVEPMFDTYLKQVIGVGLDNFNEYWIRSWLAGTSAGYKIDPHNHTGASISAVFYLLCEEVGAGGELVLMDPRTNANRGYTKSFSPLFSPKSILPKTGDVLIFPSFVYHYSTMFEGKLRLAMPVDLFLNESVLK